MADVRERVVGTVTTFDRFEIEGFSAGREAFLTMLAEQLHKSAGIGYNVEFDCEPRYGGNYFTMRANVLRRAA